MATDRFLSRRSVYRLLFLSLTSLGFAGLFRVTLPVIASAISTSAPTQALPHPIINASSSTTDEQVAILAGGCFWGMEAIFEHTRGVSEVISGYAGGSAETASYDQVSAGITQHAEAIRVTYDPSQISYGQLLEIYFSVAHDPTQLNRQGPDIGTQYRSAIFFANAEQQQIAQAYIDQLNDAQIFGNPIVTQVAPLDTFYAAEDYHQDFIQHHPDHLYVMVHDLPKLEQFREQFPELYSSRSSQ